jgi:hypothetical protein
MMMLPTFRGDLLIIVTLTVVYLYVTLTIVRPPAWRLQKVIDVSIAEASFQKVKIASIQHLLGWQHGLVDTRLVASFVFKSVCQQTRLAVIDAHE